MPRRGVMVIAMPRRKDGLSEPDPLRSGSVDDHRTMDGAVPVGVSAMKPPQARDVGPSPSAGAPAAAAAAASESSAGDGQLRVSEAALQRTAVSARKRAASVAAWAAMATAAGSVGASDMTPIRAHAVAGSEAKCRAPGTCSAYATQMCSATQVARAIACRGARNGLKGTSSPARALRGDGRAEMMWGCGGRCNGCVRAGRTVAVSRGAAAPD